MKDIGINVRVDLGTSKRQIPTIITSVYYYIKGVRYQFDYKELLFKEDV